MKILVDTNVIIDILCKREPFFEDSYNALNKCIDNHTIIVSASAITDIFYIARKYIGSEQAKECIRNLLDLIKISDTRGAVTFQILKMLLFLQLRKGKKLNIF